MRQSKKRGSLSAIVVVAGLLTASVVTAQQAAPAANSNVPLQTANAVVSVPQAKPVQVPEGTKVLLALRSPINTKTAKPGDGVYLSSSFPVVANGHVVIPAGVYVQGVIDQVTRPGRVKGRAAVRMHFTSMIFPNGSVVSIPGVVDSVPGSDGARVQDEGAIQQSSNKGKDAGTVAGGAISGATIGTVAGAISGHPIAGAGYGALAGGAAGLLYTLFTRGDEVVLSTGQTVEMMLQRSLTITQANLTGPDVAGQTAIMPSAQQPMAKPKTNILCPLGGLGCS